MAWTWRAKGFVFDVVDGDTLRVRLNLGWRVWFETYIRIIGIDAPEQNTKEGANATIALKEKVKPADEIIIKSHDLDKYGRTLAEIWLVNDSEDLGTWLVSNGHAQSFKDFVEGGTLKDELKTLLLSVQNDN